MAGSPVLVGALTVLVVVVAVFLSYNANKGLPFVPTYDLTAEIPNAAQLVKGNEVRVGGFRVGVVDQIFAKRTATGGTFAQIHMKLDKTIQPLPVDSTLVVRARSALGLKYVEIDPGTAKMGFRAGDTVPLSQATPHPVDIDQVFNTFDLKTRQGARNNLIGIGGGVTGRGADLNTAITLAPRLLSNLEPVTTNLADVRTHLKAFFPALERAASIVRPAAQTQADLFGNLDTTFTALSGVARPFIQDTISKSPPAEDTAIAQFPQQRPFLENTAAFFRELRPGVRVLPATLPNLADALQFGVTSLRRSPQLNKRLEGVFLALQRFSSDPNVPVGISRLNDTVVSLKPTLKFLVPAQTTCNYLTLWFRNISSVLSEGDRAGTWQRFIIVPTPQGPNSESGPSSAPANDPASASNHLHTNPYPNTAAPGQTHECEAGNEPYYSGKTMLSNVPGNQGTKTSGQVGKP
ncbi:MAG: phospholipid/cholesterol/gamma-HCH transport system substrate-binding protein [Thermoleophilaceae bacterium]|jgi:virulence factor Mce-like protein|nr:phospholipid/cholesterol/gamma-HCH transport system substrate-binding protein [Thermoleophilaceae bacterium]